MINPNAENEPTTIYFWYDGEYAEGPVLNSTINIEDYSQTKPATVNHYLKFIVDDNKMITHGYACIIFNEKEYCLEGGVDGSETTENYKVLKTMQANNPTLECKFDDYGAECAYVSDFSVLEQLTANSTDVSTGDEVLR